MQPNTFFLWPSICGNERVQTHIAFKWLKKGVYFGIIDARSISHCTCGDFLKIFLSCLLLFNKFFGIFQVSDNWVSGWGILVARSFLGKLFLISSRMEHGNEWLLGQQTFFTFSFAEIAIKLPGDFFKLLLDQMLLHFCGSAVKENHSYERVAERIRVQAGNWMSKTLFLQYAWNIFGILSHAFLEYWRKLLLAAACEVFVWTWRCHADMDVRGEFVRSKKLARFKEMLTLRPMLATSRSWIQANWRESENRCAAFQVCVRSVGWPEVFAFPVRKHILSDCVVLVMKKVDFWGDISCQSLWRKGWLPEHIRVLDPWMCWAFFLAPFEAVRSVHVSWRFSRALWLGFEGCRLIWAHVARNCVLNRSSNCFRLDLFRRRKETCPLP